MNDSDPFVAALRSERDALVESAPAPQFAALWREVAARRERALQRFLVLASAVPTVLLFLGGAASLLLGGGLLSAVPLLAVAFWLAVTGAGALPGASRDPALSAAPLGPGFRRGT